MLNIEGIEELIEPTLARLGLVLHNAELRREGKSLVLRLVVDKAHKEDAHDGVTVDALAVASNEVSAVLDLEDPIDEPYRLTLDSPGVERDLLSWRHFRFAIGENVHIVTRGENAGTADGILVSIDDEKKSVEIKTSDGSRIIDYSLIKSARTVFDWDAQKGAKKSRHESK